MVDFDHQCRPRTLGKGVHGVDQVQSLPGADGFVCGEGESYIDRVVPDGDDNRSGVLLGHDCFS